MSETTERNLGRIIQSTIAIARQLNTIGLLSLITLNDMINLDASAEGNKDPRILIYSLQLLSSFDQVHGGFPDKDMSYRFRSNVIEILHLAGIFMEQRINEREGLDIKRLLSKFAFIQNYYVKNKSYEYHHYELVKDIFQPFEPVIRRIVGFTVDDVFNFIHETKNVFIRKIEDKAPLNELFKIDAHDQTFLNISSAFSTEFGKSDEFVSGSYEIKGFPLNQSTIAEKPIIKADNGYYGFGLEYLRLNLEKAFISLIQGKAKEKDADLVTKIQKRKAEYLEEKTSSYFERIVRPFPVYSKLYYNFSENGTQKRCELDHLILVDNIVLLIEDKSRGLSDATHRGAIESIKKDLTRTIEDAYGQASRAKRYITSTLTGATFEDKRGNVVVTINPKDILKYVLINVTIDDLGFFSAQLHHLKNFNMLSGDEWIWSVFVNNLRVISDLSDSLGEFLLYLERRLRMNEHRNLMTQDELDFYMLFYHHGMYFEDNQPRLFLDNITSPLDEYYEGAMGRQRPTEKPRFNIDEPYRILVKQIQDSGNRYASLVAMKLLGMNGETHGQILRSVEESSQRYLADGSLHDFIQVVLDEGGSAGFILKFFFIPRGQPWEYESRWKPHIVRRMCEYNIGEAYVIFVEMAGQERRITGLDFFQEPITRRARTKETAARSGKTGRNDPCPCGSGEKYKKCCWKADFLSRKTH